MDLGLGDEMQKVFRWTAQSGNLGLLLLWHILHFIIRIWCFALVIAYALQSYLISSGLLKKYKTLDPSKVQYMAIVVDSEEAHQTSKVMELLQWLAAIGIKRICLYDPEGVLKKSKDAFTEIFSPSKLSEEATKNDPLLDKKDLTLDFASFSDGKQGVAKAANLLFMKHYLGGDQKETTFTESDMDESLKAIGCGGPDPDLMLIYGPVRCHLGFPAWRIRYSEMVHMGPLKYKKYGSLIKAIRKFTMVRQNYGT